jgi:hypothetical protein
VVEGTGMNSGMGPQAIPERAVRETKRKMWGEVGEGVGAQMCSRLCGKGPGNREY